MPMHDTSPHFNNVHAWSLSSAACQLLPKQVPSGVCPLLNMLRTCQLLPNHTHVALLLRYMMPGGSPAPANRSAEQKPALLTGRTTAMLCWAEEAIQLIS